MSSNVTRIDEIVKFRNTVEIANHCSTIPAQRRLANLLLAGHITVRQFNQMQEQLNGIDDHISNLLSLIALARLDAMDELWENKSDDDDPEPHGARDPIGPRDLQPECPACGNSVPLDADCRCSGCGNG